MGTALIHLLSGDAPRYGLQFITCYFVSLLPLYLGQHTQETMWWKLHSCLEVTKDEKLLCVGHHPINWQCWKGSDEWSREMEKEGGNIPMQCYTSHLNQTFYSLSSKGGLHSPTWNLRSVLQKCLVTSGVCSWLVLEWQSVRAASAPPHSCTKPNSTHVLFLSSSVASSYFPWTSFPYVSSFKQVIREAALTAQTQHKLLMSFFFSPLKKMRLNCHSTALPAWPCSWRKLFQEQFLEANVITNLIYQQTCLRRPS